MAELNGSEFRNITNHIFHAFCSGALPTKAFRISLYSILMTCTLIGNLLVVAVFYRNKTLRASVHYLIVNMAISDLIVPVIVLPRMISYIYHDGLWLVDGVLGTLLCKLVWIAWGLSAFVSIFSMMAIATDRLHAVLFPMKSVFFSRNKRRLIIAAIWIASAAFRTHFLFGAKLVSSRSGLKCLLQLKQPSDTWKVFRINWIIMFCQTTVSAIVLTVLYSRIITFLYRQKSKLHLAAEATKRRVKENQQITRMLVIIVVAFYIVWIPYHVVYYISYFTTSIRLSCYFFFLSDELPLLYPVVNPVIYYIFNANFRRGFRELLCCPWSSSMNGCFQSSVSPQG